MKSDFQKIKVGLIVPVFPVYTETFFISQIKGLTERGHHVLVFCHVKARNEKLGVEQSFMLKDKSICIKTLTRFNLILTAIKTSFIHPRTFAAIIRKPQKMHEKLCCLFFNFYRCDIYHFGFSGVAVRYVEVLNQLRGKVIVSCLGTAENVLTITRKNRTTDLESAFKQTAKVHCISHAIQRKIHEISSVPTFVNHPAIDTDFFTRNRRHTQDSTVRILSVGRLVFQKGFAIGFLAIKMLKERFPFFRWTIVGEGKELEELSFYRRSLNLENHVFFAGKKVHLELKALYEDSDIFFLPSISEGLANVVLEAMSMEVAVVASDCGGIGEAIESGKNGFQFPSFDYKTMCDQLYVLCMNPCLRNSLAAQARKTVLERFSIDRYVDCFVEQYRELLSK